MHKGPGLVRAVFPAEEPPLPAATLGIGHTRYATQGSATAENAQPFVLQTSLGPLALAHNGQLTNAPSLRAALLARGVGLVGDADSELLAQLLAGTAATGEDGWPARLQGLLTRAQGAFSLVILADGALWALRDPRGHRPLCWGALPDGQGWAVASESGALEALGAARIGELAPGALLRLDDRGAQHYPAPPGPAPALCAFELLYFARPDAILEDRHVEGLRERLGARLAAEAPAAADLVLGVPDTALPAAAGYAGALGLPLRSALRRDPAVGRTFLLPTPAARAAEAARKYQLRPDAIVGRNIVLVDDTIVRGTTLRPLVARLRAAGAAAIHLRIAAPPPLHPCTLGVDLPRRAELLAHQHPPSALAALLGADSLAFLSEEGLRDVLAGPGRGHCAACFTGRPTLEAPDAA